MDLISHLLLSVNTDFLSILGCRLKFDCAVNQGKKGVVFAHADVIARVNAGSSLPDQDSAGTDRLATVPLHTQPFGLAITPVACATSALLMCH